MPISIECPHCATRVRAPDTAAGKRVKCPKCQKGIAVPAPPATEEGPEEREDNPTPVPKKSPALRTKPGKPATAKKDDTEDKVAPAPKKSPAVREKPAKAAKAPVLDEDEDEDSPNPVRAKTAKAGKGKDKGKKSNLPLLLGIGGGVLVLLLAGGGGLTWWLTRDKPPGPQVNNKPNQPNVPPGPRPGGPQFPDPGLGVPPQENGLPANAPVVELTAKQFFQDWTKDKAATATRLSKSYVQVTGVVWMIYPPRKALLGNNPAMICLKVEGSESISDNIICEFVETDPWTKVSVGQEVKIKGENKTKVEIGEPISYPTLQRCTFVDLKPKPSPSLTADELASAYLADPKGTPEKYDDQYMVLTGVLDSKTMHEFYPVLILKTSAGIKLHCRISQSSAMDEVAEIMAIPDGRDVKVLVQYKSLYQYYNAQQKAIGLNSCTLLK